MKIKKFVAPHITTRLIGVLCFSFSIFTTWFWQSQPEFTPSRFLVQLQPEPEKIQQKRNLSDYVFGGRIFECNEMSKNEAFECYNRARNFILKHWKERNRACIIIDLVGTHGDVEKHIFIEPDHNNEWRIVFTEDTYSETRGFNPNISVRTARSIKTERANQTTFYYKKSNSYLVFLDRNGKQVDDF